MEQEATITSAELKTELSDMYTTASVETCKSLEALLKAQGEARAAEIVSLFRGKILFNAQALGSEQL